TSDASGAFELALPGLPCAIAVTAPQRATVVHSLARPPATALRLPMPNWRDGPTALRVQAPVAGVAWSVRIAPFAAEFVDVAADQPFTLPLEGPLLATLRVRTLLDGVHWSAPRSTGECALLGTFDVSAALGAH